MVPELRSHIEMYDHVGYFPHDSPLNGGLRLHPEGPLVLLPAESPGSLSICALLQSKTVLFHQCPPIRPDADDCSFRGRSLLALAKLYPSDLETRNSFLELLLRGFDFRISAEQQDNQDGSRLRNPPGRGIPYRARIWHREREETRTAKDSIQINLRPVILYPRNIGEDRSKRKSYF